VSLPEPYSIPMYHGSTTRAANKTLPTRRLVIHAAPRTIRRVGSGGKPVSGLVLRNIVHCLAPHLRRMVPISILMLMMGLFLFDTRSGPEVCTIVECREMFEISLYNTTMFYHSSNTNFMMDNRAHRGASSSRNCPKVATCKIFRASQAPELKSA
jgi:hypothetical protein